jgi:predicted O-methyltransferase YrrM
MADCRTKNNKNNNESTKKASAKHISEVGNYGDARERVASEYLLKHAPPNDPNAALAALEHSSLRWTLLHLGKEKGEHLDRAVREVLAHKSQQSAIAIAGQSTSTGIRVLEIGGYIGYSAIRIGRILSEANNGSTLLSLEQNEDNVMHAKKHVQHTGLERVVTMVHTRVEEYNFDTDPAVVFDLVFIDHRKPFYLQHMKLLEAKGIINTTKTTVVADNVASHEHIRNRKLSIEKGKRVRGCMCINKACNFLIHVRTHYATTELFHGDKDCISVSKPHFKSNIDGQ